MNEEKNFIHLKVKSHYSILEGSMKISDIVSEAKKNKMPAVALVDNSNVFGAMEFTKDCLEKGIQPIIGCNLNIELPSNINANNFLNKNINVTLLVKNGHGWRNLSFLISQAHLNFKEKRSKNISTEELCNYNNGLICLFSDVYEIDFNSKLNFEVYVSLLSRIKEVFNNRLYIDLFRDGLENTMYKEVYLLDLSKKLDIPLSCTNDICFLDKSIYDAHDCLNCISQNTTIDNPNRKKSNIESYFKDSITMNKIFSDKPEAILNTINIAKRCSFILEEKPPNLPNVGSENNNDEVSILKDLSIKGLKRRLNISNFDNKNKKYSAYQDRLEYELNIITDMGYAGYFLIVSDFISWAKKNTIPVGPGRGSGAGSIVAWALNITNLDPIRYGLLFERFLNPERVSLPDFDIDFCTIRRDEVIAYVRNKYGNEKVAQIITFGRLQPKAVIRDIGRVLGINYGIVDKLAKTIPMIGNESLSELFNTNITMQSMIKENEELQKLYEISVKLEGLNRNASTHAGGLVISNSPIKNDVPLYYDLISEIPATQFSMKFLEKVGLIKFDLLGVETLTVLDKALKLILKRGIDINLDDIDLNDSKTYETLSSGLTLGVFQLESVPMRNILKELKPDRIEDIIAVVALYRPGPMENIPSYIKRKHNNKLTTYQHPLLEKVLKETHGIMIYQEQVMQATQLLAGFSLSKADLLRRAIGKKIKSEMDNLKDSFVKGCCNKNIPERDSKKIFSEIEKFAGYGFNKSHAAAYAIISYQTAWLKSNYPVEYFASLLNSEAGKTGDKLLNIMVELSRLDINLLPSDINTSEAEFSVQKNKEKLCIRSGLTNIKNIGVELAKFVVLERKKNGPFKSIINFFSRVDDKVINKRQVEFLAMAGVFDSLEVDRSTVFNSSSNLISLAQNFQKDRETSQQALFSADLNKENVSGILNSNKPWSKSESLMNEYFSLGFFVSENPLVKKRFLFKNFSLANSLSIENNKVNGKIFELLGFLIKKEEKTINHKKVFELLFLDEWGTFSLLFFSDNESFNNLSLSEGDTYIITVVNSVDNERKMRLRLKSIRDTDSFITRSSNIIKIYLDNLNKITILKNKLTSIQQGTNNVILVYNGYEVDTGIKLKYDHIPFDEINRLDGISINN